MELSKELEKEIRGFVRGFDAPIPMTFRPGLGQPLCFAYQIKSLIWLSYLKKQIKTHVTDPELLLLMKGRNLKTDLWPAFGIGYVFFPKVTFQENRCSCCGA